MRLDDVYVISDKLDLATEDQIRAAERALGTRFPSGYQDYVTTLGAGTLNGQVRVLVPAEIVERTREYRKIEAETAAACEQDGFSMWDQVEAGLDLLPPDRWLEAVLLVDPSDGHRIVFHPDAPDDLIFIPHEEMEVYLAGHTLEDALTWFLETGPWGAGRRTDVLGPDGHFITRPVHYFEPDRDREQLDFNLQGTGTFPEVRAYLLDMAMQRPQDTLFVSEGETNVDEDDGLAGEVLHVFVKEYAGAIWSNDSPYVQISYDRERRTPSLEQLIDFCCTRARPFWA